MGFLSALIPAFRASSQGGRPLSDPGLADWFGGGKSLAGVEVDEITAFNYSAVYCAITYISSTVARLPLKLYRRKAGSGGRGKEEITDHPAARVLRRMSRESTAVVAREALIGHGCTWGNIYAEIERSRGGEPLSILPISPRRVRVERDQATKALIYRVDNPSGATVTIQPRDMLHVPAFGFDGLVGKSPIRLARESIGLGIATEKFGAAWFGNGSRPSGFIRSKMALGQAARDNLKKSIEDAHRGVESAHGIIVLEEDLDWKQAGIPPEDAQFLQTRQFQIPEISRWFHVPPHKLFDLSGSKWANIEQQSIDAVQDALMIWCEKFEQECERKLLSEAEQDEYFIEHRLEGLLRGDSAARAAFYKVMREIGVMSANDILDLENMNPIGPAGDIYLVPANMMPAGRLVEGSDFDSLAFKREVLKLFLHDGTTNDVMYNLTDIEDLIQQTGLPVEQGVEAPFLPVVAQSGPLVSGDVIKDPDGDVVGGDVEEQSRSQTGPGAGGGGDSASGSAESGLESGQDASESSSNSDDARSSSPESIVLASTRKVLREALGRMVRKEASALARELKRSGGVLEQKWLNEFYPDHRATVRSAIGAIAEACGEMLALAWGAMRDHERTALAEACFRATVGFANQGEHWTIAADQVIGATLAEGFEERRTERMTDAAMEIIFSAAREAAGRHLVKT